MTNYFRFYTEALNLNALQPGKPSSKKRGYAPPIQYSFSSCAVQQYIRTLSYCYSIRICLYSIVSLA